jgi:CcmD family protein
MSEGIIVGGWGYVIAAYAITAAGLLLYLSSLRKRKKQLEDED